MKGTPAMLLFGFVAGANAIETEVVNMTLDIGAIALTMGGFLAAALLVRRIVGPFLARTLEKRKKETASTIVQAFLRPLADLLVVLGVLYSLPRLPFAYFAGEKFLALKTHAANISIIVALCWGLWCGAKAIPQMLHRFSTRAERKANKTMALFLMRIFQAVVAAFGAVMILSELNYNVSGLITGLGLGGLTVALAAKDAAANFFGGFTIITERPFEIGDWISAGGIEGTVEDITLRSTCIRTLENALTIVPNSTLCAGAITNWTRTKMRLAQFTVGVTYSTPKAKVQAVANDIRSMLQAHPEVLHDTVQVQLSDFGQSSIDLFVMFYTTASQIAEHRRIKADVNFKIMDIMEQNGADFAFPSRSVYVESLPYAPVTEENKHEN